MTDFLRGRVLKKRPFGQTNLAAYESLATVQEILLEGAKNFARLGSQLLLGFIIVRLAQLRMLYIKASQLVGEGLASKAQHLRGACGIAALSREGFG